MSDDVGSTRTITSEEAALELPEGSLGRERQRLAKEWQAMMREHRVIALLAGVISSPLRLFYWLRARAGLEPLPRAPGGREALDTILRARAAIGYGYDAEEIRRMRDARPAPEDDE